MKLLVTGRNGQVARSLIEKAAIRGVELVALGRPELDLTDRDSIERAVEQNAPSYVINAAAFTAVDKAQEEDEAAFAVNRDGAGVLAEVCAGHDIPIIHLSTDYVFDGSKSTPYIESDTTAPLGIYGQSKLEGERVVIAANPRHVILRTAWVYSPFGNNFAKVMLSLAASRDELSVVNDQYGCPTYAPHIASAILKIVSQLDKAAEWQPWGIYNLVGSGETTWYGFADEIFVQSKKLGGATVKVHPIGTKDYPTPTKRPANSRLDCSKLLKTFSITLPHWREGTKECVTRLLKN